jgi:hypothetical protein
MSYSPDAPSLKLTETWSPACVRPVSETPSRTGTCVAAATSTSWSLTRVKPTQARHRTLINEPPAADYGAKPLDARDRVERP